MIIFKKTRDLHKWLEAQRLAGISIGFVPTMGALHTGHLSLIESSIKANPVTVCSIFVNPTQFNDPKDFEKYPITIEKDIELLANAGCDILFLPSVKEIYPDELSPSLKYDLGYLERILEGRFRPGHFQGVCMVVHRLLEIVMPDNLYLGQKDYQQCMVIKKLIALIGLSNAILVNICPTLREPDGLAMSSRNVRLNEDERIKATAIFRNLSFIKENLTTGDLKGLKETAFRNLSEAGFNVDYIEIADANDLSIIDDWDGQKKLVALAAAFMKEVRLIDNILLN
ncbi:MAG: pantoate--beta-alanine ligase [Chitinophagaceae bacterium]|nr:pantoate--beta-alanine ligase [Chitinophagaceae bacterium]HQX71473.1 pantoate--beta-alanine ligase [Chitinophagaceae bacterium]